jgi:uncharacterized protein (DUF433 family)
VTEETSIATARAVDRREAPAYTLAEAARYVRVAPATLRSWVVGRTYPRQGGTGRFLPLIKPADPRSSLLSFSNLIEAHLLRALRTEHGVSISAVRKALSYAERELDISRLLLRRELRTHAGEVLLDRYGQLVSLSKSGQLAMRKLLEAHLRRVDWDNACLPVRLYPFVRGEVAEGERTIAIDPGLAFGRPLVVRQGVSTSIIVQRIDAGETVEELAMDYDLEPSEIEEAVLYERAA